jgi:hypothetical protein
MLIKKEKKGKIMVYHVGKKFSDEKMLTMAGNYVKPSDIDFIIDHDADVYTEDNKLLLKFRKNVFKKSNIKAFYDNVIKFALTPTSNRGSTSASKEKDIYHNPKIMSNILGYFDGFSPRQKFIMKQQGKKINLTVRETRFNMDYPDKFKKLIPLIKEIDKQYEKNVPDKHKLQCKKAKQTPFKVPGTCFTTITTNINYRTALHKDSGDDSEGFGNLVVIEDGKFEGAETTFPQFGIGVDVRTGDVLLMNVHEWHGNLPMKPENKDVKRLSIVCYLRYNVWQKTKHMTKKQMIKHNKTVKNLRQGNLGKGNLGEDNLGQGNLGQGNLGE